MRNYIAAILENNQPLGEKVAIVDQNGTRQTTWKELYQKSCAVASYAASRGLQGLVPVCMPRCAELVEVLFGLGLAGIGVAPLSDHTPQARIAVIEEQSGNRVWTRVEYDAAMTVAEGDFAPVDFAPDAAAYVVYTSGSTGTPKGVMLSSEAVEKAYRRIAGASFLGLREGDRMLQATSAAFIALMANLYAPLFAGVVTHILPEDARTDMAKMTDYIRANQITAAIITSTPLHQLEDAPTLRVVCTGSERLTGVGPKGYKLVNAWGMSETGAFAVGYSVTEPMRNTPIGQPTEDFHCYILDEAGNPADEGELCVSGPIALGYYGLPALTAEVFTPNPFCDEEGHRVLLHTGDMVRRLDDGNLLYLNRRDFMIKINGQRVEPGEVETAIGQMKGVRSAAVKGFTDEDGHSYLCAYYVGETDEDTIRTALEAHLPTYMIPAFYVKMDALPLNANGKLDRKALEAPSLAQLHSDYAAPVNETEAALCSAFEQVLNCGKVGANDDFFRLGGDSIRAMKIVSISGVSRLNTAAVLTGRTPRGIAALAESGEEALFASPAEKKEKVRLTASQMGIYLACASVPESIKYNIPFSLRFERTEQMTPALIQSCVDGVLAKHSALLSRIVSEDDKVFMCRTAMPKEGICTVEEMTEENEANIWESFVRPFPLDKAPLCRAKALLSGKSVRILLDIHHIVTDGTSVALLVEQLRRALAGESPEEEQFDAFDLYEWERRSLESLAPRAKEHFDKLLGGVELDSNLLADFKSEAIDPPAEQVELRLDGLDLTALRRLGITKSSFFMGVFGYTLAKMTGQSECLFAAAESGRKSDLLAKTVSMLVRTLPVYLRLDEKESAVSLLKQLQEQFYASIENDVLPFTELAREYGATADVMFVYQSDILGAEELEIHPTGSAISNFNAAVFKEKDSYRVKFEYRSDLYSRETVERFAELFRAAAAAFANNTPLNEIPLLGRRDREFLDTLNQTDSPYKAEETIVDMFRRRVSEMPEKAAVVCEGRTYSYARADEISDRIAGYIHGLGIGKGQTVSVLVARSEYMFLAGMGVMKAGAMYQPLDPSYPAERLSFMRQDASSALLIADRELLPILTDFEGRVLFTDEIPQLPAVTEPIEAPCAEDGFVLLYTSGTTGKPKGCMLMHSNLTAMIHAYVKLTGMNRDSIAGAYASYGFDAHMSDLYPVISVGGTVVIVPDAIRLDLQAVRDYCENNAVTHLILTTQLCLQFVSQYRRLEHLKCMVSGGEKMVSIAPPETYTLMNCYGPTECTVLETEFTVDKLYEDIPIGTSLVNTKLYVVDGANRRVPVGVPGELVIAGPQVACGYLNRPEKTAEVFVPNLFEENVPAAYTRCYRTGDIVRFLPDGNLAFVGRRDMQVKIRGFRIELSEVERVILDYPDIKSTTVIAVDAPAGGKCLNAYIVSDKKIDIEAMNAYIRRVKPPYMVPAATMQIDSIPLTVNGKVDKRKLPTVEMHFEDVTKPENEIQQKIFDFAVQVLGTDSFGIHTDLFLAGLSSLGSIRLCSMLAEELNLVFQIRTLKKCPTVAKLEEYVRRVKGEESREDAPKAAAVYASDHPISKTMEGIFTECIAKPESSFYNIPYLLRLMGKIDEERLKAALAAAVEAHPYMKTELFTDKDGHIRQHRRLDDVFTAGDIRVIEAESIDAIRAELVKPFRITENRLFEIALIHADGCYLFLNFHHVIADGTSLSIFLSDVEKAYAGETLPTETYTGFDAAEDEAKARTAEDLTEAKNYYAALLEGLDRAFLPLPDVISNTGLSDGKLTVCTKAAKAEDIGRFCEQNRLSRNAFFVSAFGLTLSRYAGTDYAVFNTIYNGRNDTRTMRSFGMFVKTLPVVVRTDCDSAHSLTAQTSAQLMDSMANDLYSYGEIARSFGVENDIMFVYQGDGFTRDLFCGGRVEEIVLPLSESKTPVSLQLIQKNGELVCELEYDPRRFTEKLMSAFLSAFDMACAELAAGKKPGEISLLSPEAEAEMERFNDTDYDYDRTRTITDMFLEKAALWPEALCVAYKNRRVSYREAGELSGKLALYLMERGIGTGDVAAILIHRNENMVITAHGALRAGAAYVGLDPSYPADRLAFMIKDSGAKILIAERELMDKVPGYAGEVLYTDEIAALPELTAEREKNLRALPKHRITPENDAIIIYSSGTTGVPKGSVLQHKAIVCFYHNYTRHTEMDEHARVATYASFGFDGGAMDVFCAPMSGASLFVIPDEIRLDLGALEQFYVRNSITNGFITTQVGTMFIANTKCRTLRHFLVGGEKLIPVSAPEWVCFRNGYGPSETMCYVNLYRVKNAGAIQPIGKVSSNTKEYVVDKFGHRLPFGACGELCISGGQMGRGYLNRPEKTAEAFVVNPFSAAAGYERMYRTGDVVRMLPDGNYDFVGRRDGQVKIRGFRVELSEVEGQIRKYPGVEKAVVAALDNPAGGKYLAAYIVAKGEISIEEVKAFIANEKPDYMVPAVIMILDEIPLTANGKIDMRRLPKAELGAQKKGAEAADEVEERICSIFSEVLSVSKVYADDDFFAIGGSSISAIQVIVKCEQNGMAIVYKDLFANPTAQKLAAFLRDGQRAQDISADDLETGDGHDYTALKFNVKENLPQIRNDGVGNVLLTGATGYLGSHIFRYLLDSTNGQVICLVRRKDGMSAEDRLEMMMVYYFEEWYSDAPLNRVTVIDGDMEDVETREKLRDLSFDTIINCAANVKHFAAGDELIGANFTGVENLITLAQEKDAKLIQISSLSVCGESVNGSVPAGYVFRETDLNIGQSLENKYIHSKYLAEQAVIDAVSRKRIRGKVIRLGNLMARAEDSEFQVNAGTNGFLRMFIGFAALGCFPIGMMDSKIEFSPIDAVAHAVVLLSGTPDGFTVFHAKNCNSIHYGYFLSAIRSRTHRIEIVEDEIFEQRLSEALKNERNVEKLGGLLAYRNDTEMTLADAAKYNDEADAKHDSRIKISSDTDFTTKALYRLGFAWPLVSEEYLDKMVDTLMEMNFFTEQ